MDTVDISLLCTSLSIHNRDGPVQLLDGNLMNDAKKRLSLKLVGKILSNKMVNRNAFMRVIGKIWQVRHGVDIESIAGNMFSFQFRDEYDLDKVIYGGPWSFDNALIAMEKLKGKGSIDSLNFNWADFWLQIHQVPLIFMTKEIGRFLGGRIGQVLDIDGGRFSPIVEGKENFPFGIWLRATGSQRKSSFHFNRRGNLFSLVSLKSSWRNDRGKGKAVMVESAKTRIEENRCVGSTSNYGPINEAKQDQVATDLIGAENVDGVTVALIHVDIVMQQQVDETDGLIGRGQKRSLLIASLSYPIEYVNGLDSSIGVPIPSRVKDANQRTHSWTILRRLAGMVSLPWIFLGDFNEILDSVEKLGGIPKSWNLLSDFRETLDDCGLEDLGYIGPKFTWCNKRDGEVVIFELLDRCTGNVEWQMSYPNFVVSHLDLWHSDHQSILLNFDDNSRTSKEPKRLSRFHFEECWIDNPLLESQLDVVLETDERYWKQRSRVEWLKCGGRNTKFFHMKSTVRKAHNKIKGLLGDDDQWYESKSGIEKIILNHFGNLFQTCNPSQNDIGDVLDIVSSKLSSPIGNFLDSVFTKDDILKTVLGLGAMKAPGKDRLPAIFYQKFWDKVGLSVIVACLDCLNNGGSLEKMNETLVCLIPKKNASYRISDFRPISLCNVLYKIVAKTIANIFLLALDGIIYETQSAFIPGRYDAKAGLLHALDQSDFTRLLFAKATISNCDAIRRILDTYAKASGQIINFDKSAMCVNPSLSPSECAQLSGIFGIKIVDCHEKYLGLPCFTGRMKKDLFSDITSRIWDKVKGWRDKFLSTGGKEILIKAVIQAIPTYLRTYFSFLKGFFMRFTVFVHDFGGGVMILQGNYIGVLGLGFVNPKRKEVWASKIWKFTTNPCLQTNVGEL
ncbi:hypothetical protein Ddye_001099 [Dipteronia dyeriana]|uniref:DUF4283 domain-containing protein n=1 Tax=Dipteronia dyeriana TaxID=168575 RepID=A0AAD9XNL3_9ROSI|nr:hypothetical protein Ddye_001099 [Dipteronia dyeriana]